MGEIPRELSGDSHSIEGQQEPHREPSWAVWHPRRRRGSRRQRGAQLWKVVQGGVTLNLRNKSPPCAAFPGVGTGYSTVLACAVSKAAWLCAEVFIHSLRKSAALPKSVVSKESVGRAGKIFTASWSLASSGWRKVFRCRNLVQSGQNS